MRTGLSFVALITIVLLAAACERGDEIRTYQAPKEQPAEAPQPAPVPDLPTWTVPDGWVQDAARPMRVATFRTSSDPDAPELIITRFGAENFGGMLANINRWRGMVGLEPVKDEKDQPAEKITIDGNEAAQFDMTGPQADAQPAKRLRLAMVPVGDTVWFFRLIGAAQAVEKNVAAYDGFLQSIRFPR